MILWSKSLKYLRRVLSINFTYEWTISQLFPKDFDLSFQSTHFCERFLLTAFKLFIILVFNGYFLHIYNLHTVDIVT